ncbi:MAG: flavin reductase family protein [Rhizobiales bacterium]|nr:flavin reductase family protein [Hyphomicrobiales bacterium]
MRPPKVDHASLRQALGCFATGVAVITTLGERGAPVGLTVNSFSSVSLDPPLILWSLSLTAPSLGAFRRHAGFAVNIMAADAKAVVQRFARPSPDKFADVAWRGGHLGVPLLNDVVATFECRTESRIVKGDHEIYIGHVERYSRTERRPLVFHRGRYKTLGETL